MNHLGVAVCSPIATDLEVAESGVSDVLKSAEIIFKLVHNIKFSSSTKW